MSFPTQFDKRERVITCSGNPIYPKYHAVMDKNGHYELEEDKLQFRNIYEEIQSFADACNVHKILQRFINGETDVLSKVQGVYGDLVSMPKTIYEFVELENKAREHFDTLDPDIKERFDNSYMQYTMLANNDPDEFFARHKIKNPYKEEEKASGEGVDSE